MKMLFWISVSCEIKAKFDKFRDFCFALDELERWRDRIFEAIHQREVVDDTGKRIPLDEVRGIDILGIFLLLI